MELGLMEQRLLEFSLLEQCFLEFSLLEQRLLELGFLEQRLLGSIELHNHYAHLSKETANLLKSRDAK